MYFARSNFFGEESIKKMTGSNHLEENRHYSLRGSFFIKMIDVGLPR